MNSNGFGYALWIGPKGEAKKKCSDMMQTQVDALNKRSPDTTISRHTPHLTLKCYINSLASAKKSAAILASKTKPFKISCKGPPEVCRSFYETTDDLSGLMIYFDKPHQTFPKELDTAKLTVDKMYPDDKTYPHVPHMATAYWYIHQQPNCSINQLGQEVCDELQEFDVDMQIDSVFVVSCIGDHQEWHIVEEFQFLEPSEEPRSP